jgi:glycosyltransferase involved in cell wall biosynthesis
MRITIVQGAFFPVPPLLGGAVEKIWNALGKEFAARGHQVTHVSRRHQSLPDRETVDGVQHVRVPGFSAPKSSIALKFLDFIYSCLVLKHLPPADILVTNTFWLPILIRHSKCGAVYVHIQRYPRGQMSYYAHAARLQTVSEAIAEAVKRQAPRLSKKVVVIPNPLPELCALQHSAPSKDNTVLFVGRVHPEKGLEILLRAFALVRAKVPAAAAWRLKIVGPWRSAEGGGGERYYSSLQKLGGVSVDWLGPIFDAKELQDHYRRAAIFVYPSIADHGEASPVAPIEAMSAECATVVSSIDCFTDYLRHRINGWMFDHRGASPETALCSVLQALILDPQSRRCLGKEAKATVGDLLPGQVAERYLEDFRLVIESDNGIRAVRESNRANCILQP